MRSRNLYPIFVAACFLVFSSAQAQVTTIEKSDRLDPVYTMDCDPSMSLLIENSPEFATVFNRLAVLIQSELPAEVQSSYLGDCGRKGYLNQIRSNDTPRRSKFKVILGLNNGEGLTLIKSLPKLEFSEIWSTLEHLEARAENEQARAENKAVRAAEELLKDLNSLVE